jgi:hypothetical protein
MQATTKPIAVPGKSGLAANSIDVGPGSFVLSYGTSFVLLDCFATLRPIGIDLPKPYLAILY